MMRVLSDRTGQMTVEAVIALPVMITIAVIAINAVLFFDSCAVFDRQFRLAVTTFGTSPAHGEGVGACTGRIEGSLRGSLDETTTDVKVSASGHSPGWITYRGELLYSPTLFGARFSGSVFGVSLPPLRHQMTLTVDPYRPGAIV